MVDLSTGSLKLLAICLLLKDRKVIAQLLTLPVCFSHSICNAECQLSTCREAVNTSGYIYVNNNFKVACFFLITSLCFKVVHKLYYQYLNLSSPNLRS